MPRSRPAALLIASLSILFGWAAHAERSALERYGDVGEYAIIGIAAAISLAKEDPDGLRQLGLGALATYGTVRGLKYAVRSERPDGGSRSFPSGHTSGAFSGASYLHYRYGWTYGLPAYVAAAVVGYSRIDADKHFWRDVVGGAVIANAFAYAFTDAIDSDVVLLPIVDASSKSVGIFGNWKF